MARRRVTVIPLPERLVTGATPQSDLRAWWSLRNRRSSASDSSAAKDHPADSGQRHQDGRVAPSVRFAVGGVRFRGQSTGDAIDLYLGIGQLPLDQAQTISDQGQAGESRPRRSRRHIDRGLLQSFEYAGGIDAADAVTPRSSRVILALRNWCARAGLGAACHRPSTQGSVTLSLKSSSCVDSSA